jgi:hypothetical protein
MTGTTVGEGVAGAAVGGVDAANVGSGLTLANSEDAGDASPLPEE